MEVVSSHTASLLTSLNLQRKQAQFCDCVVRQRQSPSQLYPAHRCVLAASSPMLASILSSSGALVELQEPCLSGSVLAHLMDYIYTGTLPYAHTQQCYYSLLTAADYLQMGELLKALRAWQEKNDSDACGKSDIQPSKDGLQTAASSWDTQHHQYSDKFEICDAVQMHSASVDSSTKGGERECGTTSIKCTNCSHREVKNENSCSSLSGDDTNNLNTVSCRKANYVTPEELFQNVSHSTKVHGESKAEKEMQKNLIQSSGIVTPQTCQRSAEEELVSKVETSRYSFSSPHPYSGAVPVIRHSSRAATLQLAHVSTVPLQASVKSKSTSVSRSDTDNDRTVEGISTKHTIHIKNPDLRSWDNLNSSDQCSVQDFGCISGTYHAHILHESGNSNSADYFMEQDDNNHRTHCGSFQKEITTEHLGDDLGLRNNSHNSFNCRLKHKTELKFDDLPSKHQHLDLSDRHNLSAEKLSQQQRVVVPLSVERSKAESDPQCVDMCPVGEADEEHSCSGKCQAERDRQDLHSDLCAPKKDWCQQLYKDETRTQDTHSDNRDTAQGDKSNHCIVFTTPESASVAHGAGHLFALNHTSVKGEKTSEITDMCLTFPVSTDREMSGPMYDVVGQSYCGRLHYHCLPQEDTHLLHGDFDHKHSQPSQPDYSDHPSDEEQAGTFSTSGPTSHSQQLSADMTQEVLLLDISAKHAELLVSYKHRTDEWEKTKALKNDTFMTRIVTNDRQQRDEVDKTNNRPTLAKLGSESFVEGVAETQKERKSVSKQHKDLIPDADVTHNTGFMEKVSIPETVSSHPGVLDSLQDSVPSNSSVCTPSTSSAAMPRNISTHLSTPLHPFQCFLCDRSFSQRGSLNRHMRSHLGVRPFSCPRCPMTFSRQYRVTEHMRVHQRCPQGNDFPKPPVSSM